MSNTPARAPEPHEIQQHFELFLKHTNEGGWDWVDLDMPEQWWSPRFYELMGYRDQEIDSSLDTFQRLLHPDDAPQTMQALQSALDKLDHFESNFRLRVKGGAYRWFRGQANVLRNKAGQAIRMTGSLADIHERILLEAELEGTRLQAFRAREVKQSFLAMMSHEVRTPLSAILGFSEILLDTCPDADTRDVANTIHSNGQYLLDTLNDFLDLSQIEDGQFDLEIQDCCPLTVIENLQSLIARKAEQKGLFFEVNLVSPLPDSIKSNPIRLKQILLNLIGAAINDTSEGIIRLTIDKSMTARSSQQLIFTIHNPGTGLNTEAINQIFAGRQLADLTSPVYAGGLGLSLSLARHLVRLLGGDIALNHESDSGSTITFSINTGASCEIIPQQISFSERLHEHKSSRSGFGMLRKRCRIMLVEDGIYNQRLIHYLLTKAGGMVTLVENGQQAVDQLTSAQQVGDEINELFDLILMDIQMPVLDGYAATERIREMGFTNPIIALTANVMPGDREKCLQAGCDEYLTKPLDRKKLIQTINLLIKPIPKHMLQTR
ncbi:Aerobic respiration control sensor protein ArcB [Gimesia panareensis]|uniref:histidine kinase n=1 Tax=Gimesia panareensis TaxID=2527978 RepID=A0A518FRX3_9PLAN|nr:PAS domain-containing hybrid sensor histidine kinase/response regulator [Gimesia panareensis]QDV19050.1 Aerobic respiration control sensor protein ArcB [Gimesia panareensis]